MIQTVIRDQSTLEEIILRYVNLGSIIHTDGWPGYENLANIGYEHEVVIHKYEFVSSSGVHTNRIESLWGAFKRKYRSVTHKKKDMVSSYIAEWCFKRKYGNEI